MQPFLHAVLDGIMPVRLSNGLSLWNVMPNHLLMLVNMKRQHNYACLARPCGCRTCTHEICCQPEDNHLRGIAICATYQHHRQRLANIFITSAS